MRFFDLHCDTLSEAFYKKQSLLSNRDLMLSFQRMPGKQYVQVMAIWSDNTLDDEQCFQAFLKIQAFYRQSLPTLPSHVRTLLAVEDARLVGKDLARLDLFKALGVRLLTLTWQGVSCIGGAWDTRVGLSPWGEQVVRRCFALDILPDISHASDSTAKQVLALSEELSRPVIASHSCARALCPHLRNLPDDLFRKIARRQGLVGVSFVPAHLTSDPPATIFHVRNHILHFLSLDGENTVAIGSDFDGIDTAPQGLSGVERMEALGDLLLKDLSATTVDNVLFANAHRFFSRNGLAPDSTPINEKE